MEKIAGGTAIMKNYALYELSGTVQSENTRSETNVSSTSDGQGKGGQKVRSHTTRYQTIYLKGDDGTEHAAELVDLIIPCREGHSLTLWGINQGSWFEGINHTTKQAYKSKKTLNKFTFPMKTVNWALLPVFVLLWMRFAGVFTGNIEGIYVLWGFIGAFLCLGIVYPLFLIPAKIVSVIRSKQISADKERHKH